MRLHMHPQMGRICMDINLETEILTVSAPDHEDLILSLSNRKDDNVQSLPEDVQVCGTLCKGNIWGGRKASRWFTSVLGVRCWLARHYEQKSIDENRGGHAYCNEAAILLVSQQSISYLNIVITAQGWGKLVESRHFRPNIVVARRKDADGATIEQEQSSDSNHNNPEDSWEKIVIRGNSGDHVELTAVGKCARCQMVDIDPQSGMKGNTLRALALYRRGGGSINFGTFFAGDSSASSHENFWLEEGSDIHTFNIKSKVVHK